MSEFICCDRCGELTVYSDATYVNNKPFCTTCCEQGIYALQSADRDENA
jgi:formylmethanofuran dehydrogenase subunit E